MKILRNKPQMKMVVDCNGQEITFPEIEADDAYDVGEEVELENDKSPTFESVMPDGSTIVVKDGVLVKIIEDTEEIAAAAKAFVCKRTGKSIQIFSEDPKAAFEVGNKVTVDGKEGMSLVQCQRGDLMIYVTKGKIRAIKNVTTKTVTRSIFKNNR